MAIVAGTFFIVKSKWLARQNAASFRHMYRREVLFPQLLPYYFRGAGILAVAWGVAMLVRGCLAK